MRRLEIAVGRELPLALAGIVGLITVLSLAGQISRHGFGRGYVFGMVQLFYVDREANVPTWYSSAAILLAASLLAVIAFAERRAGSGFARHWSLLAGLFLYLSIDETAVIHERTIDPLRDTLPPNEVFHHAWVLPAAALALVALLGFRKFLVALPGRTRRLFLIAGGTFLAGALGMETIGGYQAAVHGKENLTYVSFASLEELLEMTGIVIFIAALMDYLAAKAVILELRFGAANRIGPRE